MDNLEQVVEWQRLAEMDLASAKHLLTMRPVPIEVICYHCHQSAEKYLKSYLVFKGITPPKTHDLNEIRRLCSNQSANFSGIADPCSDLNAFGVQPRYPMELTLEESDVRRALSGARVVCDAVLKAISESLPATP